MAEPQLKKTWKKHLTRPVARWHQYQGNTNDCGPFCATMAANALRGDHVVDAPALARALESAPPQEGLIGAILPARIKGWATFPWGVAHALKSMGFDASWKMGASVAELQENLDNDVVSIVIVGDPLSFHDGKWTGWAHYKILYAWDPEEGWAFVDPAAPSEQVYSYQDTKEFEEQWTWMGRHLIEVRDKKG